MVDETTFGREPVVVVEIQHPVCANTFGVAPCNATGTGDAKCFNTRGTCKDSLGLGTNFALSPTPLTLYFSKGRVAEMSVPGLTTVIPSLRSVSTAPTRINLAGASRDAQGLGNRAVVEITFGDHPYSDRLIDPYLSGRTYDPKAATRGSFWSRWLARFKYRQNIVIKVYEGYVGQTLAAMKSRTYFLQNAALDRQSGVMTISGSDVLTRIEERKAQAPAASPGKLKADITAVALTCEVVGAVVGDYPAPGTVRIGSECITFSASSATADGVQLTLTARGTDGTTAATHSANDGVQLCLRYTAARIDTVLVDLISTRGGVPAAYLDTANWAIELDDYLPVHTLTTLITTPEAVTDLVSEIQEQCLINLWWDERVALVKLRAIHGLAAPPPVLTSESHILQGSFSVAEKPRERASQVWVYFNRSDPTKALDDETSYAGWWVQSDLQSETDELYGEPSIRRVFARFLVSETLAANCASKIITRYVDVPSEATFRLDAKDRAIWTGDTVTISHHMDVDAWGARRLRNWTIIQAEEIVPGEIVEYIAEDTTLYGLVSYIMAPGAANYPGAGLAPAKNCYIGDANGLLSDGSPAGRIS